MSDDDTERMSKQTRRPHEVLREGNLSVSLWKAKGERGEFLKSGGVSKTYTDQDGTIRNTSSLTGSENLRGGHLLIRAHDRITAFKEQAKAAQQKTRDR